MADSLGLENALAGFSGTADGVTSFIIWMTYLLIIGSTIGFIWWYSTFQIKITIRQQVNGDGYIKSETWARQFKDKTTKSPRWRILKPRQYVVPPEGDFIEPFRKGKKLYLSAEMDRSIHGDIVWRKPSRNDKESDSFRSEERSMAVHELREAESYKKKRLSEMIVPLANVLAIVMILVIFMLFFNQTVEPWIKGRSEMNAQMDKMTTACMAISDAYLGRITLDPQDNGVVAQPPN